MQTKTFAILAAGVATTFVAGTVVFSLTRAPDGCSGGQIAGGDIGGPFTLVDETGQTVTEADVIDGPTLIYFGYTACPDVCPIDTMRNAQAVEILEERGEAVRPVFITIDPERDTPEVVADFTDNFHDDMIGLTGSIDQVDAAAKAYRVVYSRADDEPDYYLMNHMTFSYLVDETGFIDFFRNDVGPEAMADQIACHI
ncbi:SCO family protein [Aestuariibius insulae]|uniref:SCO family protein n=1 Tax=Aestuariibius insulae TaxID=2058287 RepID=UPI00398E589E